MIIATPCFEGFKDFVFDVAGISMIVGRDYVLVEYGLVVFTGDYAVELNEDATVWEASWDNAAKFYNGLR